MEGGLPKEGGLGQFADLRGGLVKKEGRVDTPLHTMGTLCSSGARTLCNNQLMTIDTFMSQQTQQTFNIFFNLNWKSEYVIYLIECI